MCVVWRCRCCRWSVPFLPRTDLGSVWELDQLMWRPTPTNSPSFQRWWPNSGQRLREYEGSWLDVACEKVCRKKNVQGSAGSAGVGLGSWRTGLGPLECLDQLVVLKFAIWISGAKESIASSTVHNKDRPAKWCESEVIWVKTTLEVYRGICYIESLEACWCYYKFPTRQFLPRKAWTSQVEVVGCFYEACCHIIGPRRWRK